MPFYESTEQLKQVFETFWPCALANEDVYEKMVKSGMVVRFDIEQPEIHVTIDFKNPGPDGKLGTLSFDSTAEPEITVWSTSETTNKFWQGKLNTTVAMAKGQVKMQGSIAKALGLLSKIKPLFKIFPEVLRDLDLHHMVV
ncbi:MAG: SCP2 sterol-binding domain-containing protein [Candidatus Thorarchaeota archaeon]|nr:SCP2 sterol-binding domain-containing protein [Candidatus Thorarchaeota archaeon]